MDKFNRQIILLILIAISVVIPPSLYSSRKYCDAAILGILQGNPKEVVITELYSGDSSDSDTKDYYKFEADGSISLCEGLKPLGIVRDEMGRLNSFKLTDGNQEILYKIKWDDTNIFEVKEIVYIDSRSDVGLNIK